MTSLLLVALLSSPSSGDALLREIAAARVELRTLRAAYVQRRESELSPKPLETRGRLTWARSGPVLRLETERSVIRVTPERYEVWRKTADVVEVAKVPERAWTRRLLGALGGELDALLEKVEVTKVEAVEGQRRLHLRIPEEARAFELWAAADAPRLVGFAWVGEGGDRVEITLRDVERNPRLAPEATALGAPEGARRVQLD